MQTLKYDVYLQYTMPVTTIKLQQKTKKELDGFRKHGESYDVALQKLLERNKNRKLRQELTEAYKKQSNSDRAIAAEWDAVSLEVPHE